MKIEDPRQKKGNSMGRRGRKRRNRLDDTTNWHHRRPKRFGGSGDITSPNMIEVPVKHHRAYHLLFGTKPPREVARILNEIWIDPAWKLKVVAIKKETDDA